MYPLGYEIKDEDKEKKKRNGRPRFTSRAGLDDENDGEAAATDGEAAFADTEAGK